MDEFIESLVKFILEEWDKILPQRKLKIRGELVNTFICFVGKSKQDDKKIISVHLN